MAITRVPLRLEILRAISAALKEVNPDNGYEFDLRDDEHGRQRVVRGRLGATRWTGQESFGSLGCWR